MEKWKVIAADKQAELKIREENKVYKGVRYLFQGDEPASAKEDRWSMFNWREQFISNERLTKLGVIPVPGDTIKLYFDRFGAIDDIVIVEHDPSYPDFTATPK